MSHVQKIIVLVAVLKNVMFFLETCISITMHEDRRATCYHKVQKHCMLHKSTKLMAITRPHVSNIT